MVRGLRPPAVGCVCVAAPRRDGVPVAVSGRAAPVRVCAASARVEPGAPVGAETPVSRRAVGCRGRRGAGPGWVRCARRGGGRAGCGERSGRRAPGSRVDQRRAGAARDAARRVRGRGGRERAGVAGRRARVGPGQAEVAGHRAAGRGGRSAAAPGACVDHRVGCRRSSLSNSTDRGVRGVGLRARSLLHTHGRPDR